MKRIFIVLLALAALCACSQDKKVMARFVPERSDDFVFENNLIAGRFYGKALEGNPTSPGLDIWVKLPGKLVADEWYKGFQTESDAYYHHDHGGKDCYKVAVSLGGGASSPLIDGKLCYPATNYRSWDIVESSPKKVVFTLHYPQWQAADSVKVALDKTVTVVPDTYFCRHEHPRRAGDRRQAARPARPRGHLGARLRPDLRTRGRDAGRRRRDA